MELKTKLNMISFFLLGFLCHSFASSLPPTSPFPNEALPTRSGYLPINPGTNSAIFYAFYEAQNSTLPLSQTPLLVWLQGGPGCSSMVGNFFELGPYLATLENNDTHFSLKRNQASWNRIFGLIFLDNPIGVGFSIASKPEEIPRDQKTVGKHLFAVITSFIGLDRSLFKDRPVYITGESYAGKYVPSIGYYILKKNKKLPASKQVNLRGVAIGNGLTDPVTQVQTHALNSYFSGMVNERQKRELERAQEKAVKLIKDGNWSGAVEARSEVFNLLTNMTKLYQYDYTKPVPSDNIGPLFAEMLNLKEVKRAFGANESMVFDYCSNIVADALKDDIMQSVKYMVEYLVKESGLKVMLYQGMYDLRDGVVSTEAWVKTMKWDGLESFLGADRKVWEVNGGLAGYVQKWEGLSHVVVWGAGHMVPAYQGLNAQVMIEDWVLDRGVFSV